MGSKYKVYNVGLLGLGRVLCSFIKHYLQVKNTIIQKYKFMLNFVAIADSCSFVEGKNLDVKNLIKRKSAGESIGKKVDNSLDYFIPLIRNKKLDILIDGLPGSKVDAGLSYPLLIEAIKNRVHLLCANKSPFVFKGAELFKQARKKNVYLGLSAVTGGALPTVDIINDALLNAGIYNVRGILNGTSNFVLDKIMFESKTKLEAVQEAIKLGIAEPDYRFDLEGIDTCYKMIILGLIITGRCADLKSIPCRGIMDIDEREINFNVKKGNVLRLIGNLLINNGEPKISVGPEILKREDPLYGVFGASKGITFKTKYMGDLTIIGGASGLDAIAATIMKDIINLHRSLYK